MGLTASGKTLCYINNFGNGKNSAGGTDYPRVILYGSISWNPWKRNVYVDRSYVNPRLTDKNYNFTNYKHLIDSLVAIPTSGGSEYTVLGSQVKIAEGSYNKENDNSSYANPIILHATVTIKNNSSGNVTYDGIKLQAKNIPIDTYEDGYHHWDYNSEQTVDLASVSIEDITLAPGDIATFTIIIG